MKNIFSIHFSFFLYKLIVIFITLNFILNSCDNRNEPILIPSETKCEMKYCTEEDFINKTCIKDNTIIKTQWLNNIIKFGEKNCKFSKFAKYINGDIIAFCTPEVSSQDRYFYGLKENGRPLFIDQNDKETYIKLLKRQDRSNYELTDDNNVIYEGEIYVVQIGEIQNEYIVNIWKRNFTELYDFENNDIYFRETIKVFPFKNSRNVNVDPPLSSIRCSIFQLKESNNIFFSGIFYDYLINYDNEHYIILYELQFNNKEYLNLNEPSIIRHSSKVFKTEGYMVSCFQKGPKVIVCFYILSLYEKKYRIVVLNEKFEEQFDKIIDTNYINSRIFFKSILIEPENGVFIYYKKLNDVTVYPTITFKKIEPRTIDDIIELNEIKIKTFGQYTYNTNINLNDFIQISKELICFSSVSTNKEILYIILIDLLKEKKLKIRYYIMRTFGLYNYKFYSEIRLNIFNESIALTSSYCEGEECNDENTHFSSLILFSYPNSKDISINIVDELFDKNIKIDELELRLNLSEYISIDNNIFGLIFANIVIISIENCEIIKLISLKSNEDIYVGYELIENEEINVTINNYELFDCTIGYMYKITEPDYQTYNEYPEKIDTGYGDDTESLFNDKKKIYSGRLSYYNLYLKDRLTMDCNNNCELCYDNLDKNCIVCKTNSTFEIDINNTKKCALEAQPSTVLTELQTEFQTEFQTELQTELKTELQTEKETDKPTEKPTDKPTDKPTEKPTDKPTEVFDDISKTDCTNEEIISSHCTHGYVKNDQYEGLNNQIKKEFLNKTTYHGETKVIITENVIFQLSKLEDQNDDDKSTIDLGKCEEMLKKKNNIPEEESLIIYKSDIKSNDLSCTYVQYEIFHPNTLEPLDLSDCSEKEISISVPTNLDDDILSLYNDLDKSGYNFFDENDPFYNDICMTYTTENGTDMSISDRKQEIEDKGKNLCQSGCKLSNYNSTNKKVKCSCDVNNKKTISRLDDISFNSVLIQNLFNELKYSNYYVLKCYKLLFNFKLLKKNIGFILMAIIFISILILFFIYIIKGRKKIEHYIKNILRNKSRYINNRKILKEKNKSNNLNNQEKKKRKKRKIRNKNKKKIGKKK